MRAWTYADTRTASVGTMRCTACQKPIVAGRFRYRYVMRHDGYAVQHEACTSDDPEWAAMNERAAANAERHARFVAACAAFKAEWGVDDLDNYLPDTTP